jgi:twitching motility two-component system response regulator PilG
VRLRDLPDSMPSPTPIPSASEVEAAAQSELSERARGRLSLPPLVLVVEDDQDTLLLYRESLEHLGYRTAGESDGLRGIEAALRLRPHAILLDAEMPGLHGVEVTRRIKADPRTRRCLVIVATGYGMAMYGKARAAGCDAFFQKPFDPSAFDRILESLSTSPEPPKPRERSAFVKRCACSREFAHDEWQALPLCGRMHLAQRNAVVELRNCSCGSTLSLDLEALIDAVPGTAVGTSAHEGAREAERRTLFLVDRDPYVRRLLKQFVSDAYAVEFFDSGSAALDRTRKSPPCALVTEILVPGLDGLSLCRSLKADPSTEHVPVLVFSMLAADERARQAGANAFLAKPIERRRLVESLRGLIDPRARPGPPRPEQLRAS